MNTVANIPPNMTTETDWRSGLKDQNSGLQNMYLLISLVLSRE